MVLCMIFRNLIAFLCLSILFFNAKAASLALNSDESTLVRGRLPIIDMGPLTMGEMLPLANKCLSALSDNEARKQYSFFFSDLVLEKFIKLQTALQSNDEESIAACGKAVKGALVTMVGFCYELCPSVIETESARVSYAAVLQGYLPTFQKMTSLLVRYLVKDHGFDAHCGQFQIESTKSELQGKHFGYVYTRFGYVPFLFFHAILHEEDARVTRPPYRIQDKRLLLDFRTKDVKRADTAFTILLDPKGNIVKEKGIFLEIHPGYTPTDVLQEDVFGYYGVGCLTPFEEDPRHFQGDACGYGRFLLGESYPEVKMDTVLLNKRRWENLAHGSPDSDENIIKLTYLNSGRSFFMPIPQTDQDLVELTATLIQDLEADMNSADAEVSAEAKALHHLLLEDMDHEKALKLLQDVSSVPLLEDAEETKDVAATTPKVKGQTKKKGKKKAKKAAKKAAKAAARRVSAARKSSPGGSGAGGRAGAGAILAQKKVQEAEALDALKGKKRWQPIVNVLKRFGIQQLRSKGSHATFGLTDEKTGTVVAAAGLVKPHTEKGVHLLLKRAKGLVTTLFSKVRSGDFLERR